MSNTSTTLPAPFAVPSRSTNEATYKQALSARVPGIDISDGSPADVDAKQIAGVLSPAYAVATKLYKATTLQGKTGQAVDDALASRGEARLPAAGANGFVSVSTALAGVTIPVGLTGTINGKTYKTSYAIPTLVTSTTPVPLIGVDVGPSTDQPAGATGTWIGPPPGLLPSFTVLAQSNGQGLSGGALQETDAQAIARMIYEDANPAASGNEADYIKRVLTTPGLAIETAWVYSDIQGDGTLSLVFTMRQASSFDSRIPNTTEIAAVAAWLPGAFPKSDKVFVSTLTTNPITVVYQIQWTTGVAAWADSTPFPAYSATFPYTVDGSSTPTALTFSLLGDQSIPAPAAGNNIAFFDPQTQLFVQKRILTATPHIIGPYTAYNIVCDTTGGVSDTSYVPVALQACGPWSDALNLLAAPTVTAMNGLGPGEQLATFWDPGSRQRRSPPPPAAPYVVTHKLLDPIDLLGAVADVQIPYVIDHFGTIQSVPYTTPHGSAGVSSKLTTLGFIVAYAE